MSGFLESVIALVTAALTASPLAIAGVPAVPPEHESRCVDRVSGGRQQLTAEEKAALQRARELVTALTGSIGDGDSQAAGLGEQLRSIGITPAVNTGWRQQVHDLADTLMTVSESDPKALDLAVTLADAGFSPTPADLRTTITTTPGGASRPAGGSTIRQTCTSTAGTSSGAPGASASTFWEQQVNTVVADLSATGDPAAKEVSDRLSTVRSTGSSADSGGDSDTKDEDKDKDTNKDEDKDEDTDEDKNEDNATDASPSGSSAPPSTSRPNRPDPGSNRPDPRPNRPDPRPLDPRPVNPPPSGRATETATDDWKQLAGELSEILATADDTDPAVNALADALTQAGFTGGVRGSGGNQLDTPTGDPAQPTEMLPDAATEVFRSDFETGDFSEWGNCQSSSVNGDCAENQDDHGMQILRDAQRGNVAKFEVNPGDIPEFGGGERAEVSENNANIVTREGDERWYQWSMQVPEDFQNPTGEWFIVMQWHAGEGSPPLRVEVSNDGMVDLGGLEGDKQTIGSVPRGEWVDYMLHVKFSDSDGFVEAWEDGVQTVPLTQRPTMSSDENYFKMGIYRDEEASDGSAEVLFDDFSVWAPDGDEVAPSRPGANRASGEPDEADHDDTGSTDDTKADDTKPDDTGSTDENEPDENKPDRTKPDNTGSTDKNKPDRTKPDNTGSNDDTKPDEPPAGSSGPSQDPEPTAEPSTATWDELAKCESGQRWDISTGNGYSGGLQFDRATWMAYGGGEFAPTAAEASKEEQIAVAKKVRDDRGGYGSWPACARKLGLPR